MKVICERVIYLEGHELELFVLAKIRLSVLFQGISLPEFILSAIFEILDLFLGAELYVNLPGIQKAPECYFEC